MQRRGCAALGPCVLTSIQKVSVEARGRVGVAKGEVARIFTRGGGRREQRRGHHRRDGPHLQRSHQECHRPLSATQVLNRSLIAFFGCCAVSLAHATSRRRYSLRAGIRRSSPSAVERYARVSMVTALPTCGGRSRVCTSPERRHVRGASSEPCMPSLRLRRWAATASTSM